MLRPGPWGTAPISEATQPGGGTGRRVGCARTVISQIQRARRGTNGPTPRLGRAVPVLGGLSEVHLTPSSRKGWLSEVCRSLSSQGTNTRASLVARGHVQPPPTQACSAGEGTSPGERQRTAPWCGEPAGREAPRPHTGTSFLLGSEHPPRISPTDRAGGRSRGQEGVGLAGAHYVAGCSVF